MKAYIIWESCSMYDDSITIGVCLDKQFAKKYVGNKNSAYNKWEKSHKKCFECRENGKFKFKKTCKYCVIKQDRHGVYCKNDRSSEDSYDRGLKHYGMYEINILDYSDEIKQ